MGSPPHCAESPRHRETRGRAQCCGHGGGAPRAVRNGLGSPAGRQRAGGSAPPSTPRVGRPRPHGWGERCPCGTPPVPEGCLQRGVGGRGEAEAGGGKAGGRPFPLRAPPMASPSLKQTPTWERGEKKNRKKKKNVATMLFTHFLQKACVTCCWKGSYKGFPVAAWAASGPAPPRRAVPAAPSPRPVSCKTRGRDLSSVAEPPSADWPGRTHLFPDKPPSHGWLSINLFKKVSGVVKAERESVCVCKRG